MIGASPAFASAQVLPSGLQADLFETITEDEGGAPVIRLRYLAEDLDPGRMTPQTALEDMKFLCENNALAGMPSAREGTTIIVSLADRATPFGVIDSSVVQVFEVFTLNGGACMWEAF
ncbi:hypothetical protein DC366_03000 [Pelagivirga sediminicola]|uniref:Acetolactate synthase n=1 Tax=Pelagivirga sediminicola TaxID=2170575 RepID=A0A2T7GBX3_9RHOB|nr:DUF6497 family protein [Pelagivirga sediminicola]PVA11911.1 hypothetical protein DC366_03000 [Pelagivirga sediminicola]